LSKRSRPIDFGIIGYSCDFSLHSIGVLLFRRHRFDVYNSIIHDLDVAGVRLVSLYAKDMSALANVAIRFNLDFDDAYQYETAKRFNLTLVSFDHDFDRTDLKRVTPEEVLGGM
jgi:uncharacterized protein